MMIRILRQGYHCLSLLFHLNRIFPSSIMNTSASASGSTSNDANTTINMIVTILEESLDSIQYIVPIILDTLLRDILHLNMIFSEYLMSICHQPPPYLQTVGLSPSDQYQQRQEQQESCLEMIFSFYDKRYVNRDNLLKTL
jgi:hypothetical protein